MHTYYRSKSCLAWCCAKTLHACGTSKSARTEFLYKTDISMYETDISMYETDISMYETDISMYETDIGMYETDISMYETGSHISTCTSCASMCSCTCKQCTTKCDREKESCVRFALSSMYVCIHVLGASQPARRKGFMCMIRINVCMHAVLMLCIMPKCTRVRMVLVQDGCLHAMYARKLHVYWQHVSDSTHEESRCRQYELPWVHETTLKAYLSTNLFHSFMNSFSFSVTSSNSSIRASSLCKMYVRASIYVTRMFLKCLYKCAYTFLNIYTLGHKTQGHQDWQQILQTLYTRVFIIYKTIIYKQFVSV